MTPLITCLANVRKFFSKHVLKIFHVCVHVNDLINYRDWYLKIVFGGYRESCPLKKFPPEDCPYSKPNPNPNANAGGVYWGGAIFQGTIFQGAIFQSRYLVSSVNHGKVAFY